MTDSNGNVHITPEHAMFIELSRHIDEATIESIVEIATPLAADMAGQVAGAVTEKIAARVASQVAFDTIRDPKVLKLIVEISGIVATEISTKVAAELAAKVSAQVILKILPQLAFDFGARAAVEMLHEPKIFDPMLAAGLKRQKQKLNGGK